LAARNAGRLGRAGAGSQATARRHRKRVLAAGEPRGASHGPRHRAPTSELRRSPVQACRSGAATLTGFGQPPRVAVGHTYVSMRMPAIVCRERSHEGGAAGRATRQDPRGRLGRLDAWDDLTQVESNSRPLLGAASGDEAHGEHDLPTTTPCRTGAEG